MLCSDVRAESSYGSNESDAVPSFGVTPVKVVFGQWPDEPVSTEQQRKGFQHRTLACPIRSNKHRLALTKVNLGGLNSSEVLDVELSNPHRLSPPFHGC